MSLLGYSSRSSDLKAWSKVYHFLGSIRFTIALFAVLILSVAFGTWIETSSGSHESASEHVYRHPLFLSLLAAIFLNLLFAAFRKLPWKVKHIPFLLAHLGLMTVIAGAAVNVLTGYSGIMALADDVSGRIVVPGTHALCILTREGRPVAMANMEQWKSKAKRNVNEQIFSTSGLEAALISCAPHARQKLKCSYENQISFCLPEQKASFQQIRLNDSIQTIPVVLGKEKWQASALKGGYVGEHVAELLVRSRRDKTPSLSFIRDENLDEYVVLISKGGSVAVNSVESLLKRSLVSFDDGARGYGIEAEIPPEMGGGVFYIKLWPAPEQLPSLARVEDNIPCAHVCFSQEGRSEILSLTYDPSASAFLWPLFDGKYFARYQPMEHVLPWNVQLKEWTCAHEDHFSHTEQCRLNLILVDSNGAIKETSIGYNAPFSPGKGYQLTLLKNLPGAVEARIGVQYAIAKKTMIYPGVFCAGLGILSLYLSKLGSVKNDKGLPHAASSPRSLPRKRRRAPSR